MELRQLRHFLAVAETLSFRASADLVGLSTQAISKSIRQLEFSLGVKVFDRDTRTVSLTPFGEMLLPHARAIDAEVRQFSRSLETTLGAHTGNVRLGASPTALTRIVPEALKRLLTDRPAVKVEIERGDFTHLTAPLLRGDIDMVVTTAPTEKVDPLIAIQPMMTDGNVVIAAYGHPLTRGRPKPSAMAKIKWVTLRNFSRGDEDLQTIYAPYDLPLPKPALVTTAVDFAIDWVANSAFLAILPTEVATPALMDCRVSAVPLGSSYTSWPIVLAFRRNATRSPAALALIDMLKAVAKDQDSRR